MELLQSCTKPSMWRLLILWCHCTCIRSIVEMLFPTRDSEFVKQPSQICAIANARPIAGNTTSASNTGKPFRVKYIPSTTENATRLCPSKSMRLSTDRATFDKINRRISALETTKMCNDSLLLLHGRCAVSIDYYNIHRVFNPMRPSDVYMRQ